MRKMIADMRFVYDRMSIKPGDEFEAKDSDAFALMAYRRAHYADGEEPKKKPSRRRYMRRDMTAEA